MLGQRHADTGLQACEQCACENIDGGVFATGCENENAQRPVEYLEAANSTIVVRNQHINTAEDELVVNRKLYKPMIFPAYNV